MNRNLDIKRVWAPESESDSYLNYMDYILSIKEPTTFLMMGPEEYELGEDHTGRKPPFTKFEKHLIQYNHEVIIVTGRHGRPENKLKPETNRLDLLYYLNRMSKIKVIPWGKYWFMYSIIHERNTEYREYNNLDRLFVSMNHRPHPHRCLLVDTLAKYDLVDSNVVTWLSLNRHYKWKYWEQKQIVLEDFVSGDTGEPMEIDSTYDSGLGLLMFSDTYPKNFDNTLIQVIPETTHDMIFLTEKTVNSILHMKPFIIYGAHGSNAIMEEYGFELYTELFDYSFDSAEDVEVRAEMISAQLHTLSESPEKYQELYNSVLPKIIRNLENLIKIVFSDDLVPEEIKEYLPLLPLYQEQISKSREMISSNKFLSQFIPK